MLSDLQYTTETHISHRVSALDKVSNSRTPDQFSITYLILVIVVAISPSGTAHMVRQTAQ